MELIGMNDEVYIYKSTDFSGVSDYLNARVELKSESFLIEVFISGISIKLSDKFI